MFIYTLAFEFNGEFAFLEMSANEFANECIGEDDRAFDFKMKTMNNECRYFNSKGKQYYADFSYHNPKLINVYDPSDGDTLVKADIPYLCLSIKDDKSGKIIYNIVDELNG